MPEAAPADAGQIRAGDVRALMIASLALLGPTGIDHDQAIARTQRWHPPQQGDAAGAAGVSASEGSTAAITYRN
ncbi:hypothetical protein XarjCFBP1022_19885 [Xanthomonas arboricola]|nr:hypothetical protein XarjCFBP1022_19885 [Xanthomonas arboricola]